MITIVNSKNVVITTLNSYVPIIIWAICLLIGVALYVLMGFGIRKIGINRGLKYTKFAFVPVMRWLLVGEISGSVRVFRRVTNSIGIILAFVATAFFVMSFIIDIVNNVPIIYYAISGQDVVIRYKVVSSVYEYGYGYYIAYVGESTVYELLFTPAFLNFTSLLQYGVNILLLAYVFFFGTISFGVFRKYVPSKAFWFSLLSMLPILLFLRADIYGFTLSSLVILLNVFGIIVFCIRNKPVIDYKQYLANRYGFYGQRRYGADSNPYSNNSDSANNGSYQSDPFDSSDKQDDSDPFDDFK